MEREKSTTDLSKFWTTDKDTLKNWMNRSPARSALRRRVDAYIFKRAMLDQGFDTETRHCAREPWYGEIAGHVRSSGLPYRSVAVDAGRFENYLERHLAAYEAEGYVAQYGGRNAYFAEKALEHFLSIEILKPQAGQRVLDVASWGSPAGDILQQETGATCLRHDITFSTDLSARLVSGPAESIDAPDGYFDSLMAHCAIDNFEGDSDGKLLHEAWRILKPNGRFLIIPLHLATRAENIVAIGGSAVPLDPEATIVMKPAKAARFARHYSVQSLRDRLLERTDRWAFEVLGFESLPTERYPSTANCRFALLATRK